LTSSAAPETEISTRPTTLQATTSILPVVAAVPSGRGWSPRHASRLLGGRARRLGPSPEVWDLQAEAGPGYLLVVNDHPRSQGPLEKPAGPVGGAWSLLARSPRRWLLRALPGTGQTAQAGEILGNSKPRIKPPLAVEVVRGGRAQARPGDFRFASERDTTAAMKACCRLRRKSRCRRHIFHAHDPRRRALSDPHARQTRAVAAPTAAFHFSDALLEGPSPIGGVELTRIHPAMWAWRTFRPVERRRLNAWSFTVNGGVSRSRGRPCGLPAAGTAGVIAIGTTSVRSLEGVAALHGGVLDPLQDR